MNDINKKAKMNVLKELIGMMEEREIGSMKSKSPKFMKLEVETKPLEEIKEEKLNPEESEFFSKDESEESKEESKEDFNEEDMSEDEDMMKLLEMYKKLK